ncbi:ABC transporter permease subunit [Nonomuraea rhodomycinica]|uniref:ABC transporter permease subunit n=1 Tax=Nonomuraea rhodomycinica TaxID=1712872 RepID=A0A7Y6IPG9_9ACTN|nr:ABC transporter permease subunit [Nonomuraea rhodomycinica]NUW41910.1 ABC transporter permease subunit [Nonomuraea rhodomycinica]
MAGERASATGGFGRLVRAEWTKFRTVRGWVAGMAAAALVVVLLGLMSAAGSHTSCGGPDDTCPVPPVGPGGEAVSDHFFFAHRTLTGDGSVTARLTSMTGRVRVPDSVPGVRELDSRVVPWAKAGLIVKDGVREGSTYAAVMVTGAHGVRMQHDFTQDTAGRSGGVSVSRPRWLRLDRAGEEITGYESEDGRRWTKVGTARLPGLPDTAEIGLFAASPGDLTVRRADFGGSVEQVRFSETTAVFDRVELSGRVADTTWSRDDIGATTEPDGVTVHHPGGFHESAGTYTVTGVGDIGPLTDGQRPENTLTGVVIGLIVVIVVAVGSVTAEYRRGLIRTTLLASPRRGRVLAAKAVVIAAVTFAAGLAATAVTVPVGTGLLRGNGAVVLPVSWAAQVRLVAGVALMMAAVAVLALAMGALFRRGPAAITAGVAVIVVPHLLATASVLPDEAARWLLRLTPAAGFAVQQSIPEYPQVLANYVPSAGYYPLAPWGGLAVLCGYAALALALAVVRLNGRDA